MIKQLFNSVIAKYRDLPVFRTSIICLSLRQMIHLLATDKSRYFAQPRPIIVNYNYHYYYHYYYIIIIIILGLEGGIRGNLSKSAVKSQSL